MRQKMCALLLAALLCLMAAGCTSGREEVPPETTPPAETVPPAEETAPQPPTDGEEPPAPPTGEPELKVDPPEPGSDAWNVWEEWYLQGAELLESESLDGLQYGQTEAEAEALWGAPLERTEPEVWGSDGLTHTQWTYDGGSLSFAEGALETIRVTAPRPGQTTAGVGVGSTAEEVRAAYPHLIDEELSDETRLVAGSAYGGVIFTLEDGAVTGVTLGVTAE